MEKYEILKKTDLETAMKRGHALKEDSRKSLLCSTDWEKVSFWKK